MAPTGLSKYLLVWDPDGHGSPDGAGRHPSGHTRLHNVYHATVGNPSMHVDQDRLREDLLTNGSFGDVGAESGHGRTVLTGSDADRKAREYFVDRLESAGMEVRVDPVGNVAGRWCPAGCDPDAAPVAAGSHLDSVPRGGIFDGPLGVYAAVEAVRAMREADLVPDRPIDVVAFTEEEGTRFDLGLLGSSVACGERTPEELLELADDDGTTLATYLERIGFAGDRRIDASEWDAWLELHIEQATRLEQAGVPVGIVTAITGITNCAVRIEGESNHAGGTSMDDRTDALVAAGEFVTDVERIAREAVAAGSESAVATVGSLSVEPGARNVIPGEVTLSIDARDVDGSVMDRILEEARRSLERLERERGVEASLDRYRTVDPVPMSDRIRKTFAAAGECRGVETMSLPSGGGHDTMKIAGVTDVGMLFAPSRDGISHSPLEWTDWVDCARATQLLADALAELAGVEPGV